MPQNNQEILDNWLKLRGLVSDKTVIEHLPFDLDAESELEEMNLQNQENIEKNIENMKNKAGDANVEVSQPEDDRVEETLSKDEQEDTE